MASHLFYADLEKYEFQNPLWRCGEPFDLTWFETYKLENCLWRGGEPVLALALTNHFQKSCVARWRAIQSCLTQKHINSKNLCSEVASHSIWADYKHVNFKTTLWRGGEQFDLSWSETYKLENYLWRCSEPIHTRYSLTFDILKLLVARWQASPSSCFDKTFPKILCSEVASHLV